MESILEQRTFTAFYNKPYATRIVTALVIARAMRLVQTASYHSFTPSDVVAVDGRTINAAAHGLRININVDVAGGAVVGPVNPLSCKRGLELACKFAAHGLVIAKVRFLFDVLQIKHAVDHGRVI